MSQKNTSQGGFLYRFVAKQGIGTPGYIFFANSGPIMG